LLGEVSWIADKFVQGFQSSVNFGLTLTDFIGASLKPGAGS
jgi:hypothetical protein